MYRKSRYFTFMAVSTNSDQRLARSPRIAKKGMQQIANREETDRRSLKPTTKANPMRKSMHDTITEAVGTTILGKYYLANEIRVCHQTVARFASATRKKGSKEACRRVQARHKEPHHPKEVFAILPKTIVKTTIVKKGRISAQATPKTVCFVATLTSRQAKIKKAHEIATDLPNSFSLHGQTLNYLLRSRHVINGVRSSIAGEFNGLLTRLRKLPNVFRLALILLYLVDSYDR